MLDGTDPDTTQNHEGLPCLPGTRVEIAQVPAPGVIHHAVLDFDGTLSLLRDGWQDLMVPLMVEALEACPGEESPEALEKLVVDFVDHLTGKQTIYQMIRLAEEVERRGGPSTPPLEYKQAYNRRLVAHIEGRLDDLRSGRRRPEEFLVAGARELLELLVRSGVRCYLASGSDVEFVRQEVRLLELERFFEDRVFGALPNYRDFSKEMVIRAILRDHGLAGPELLVIGDGYVEIQKGRDAGATTWGVYSRENNRYHMNADKRGRLLRAGAHLLSEDLSECREVLRYLGVKP